MKKNKISPLSLLKPLGINLAAALLWVIFLTCSLSQAAGQNTAFLPLSIISPQQDDTFSARVDSSLETVLAKENMTMIARQKANQLVDYNSWPPSAKTLESVAEGTGQDNVAIGTLTIIGNQISIDFKVFDVLDPTHPKYFYREAPSIASLDAVITDVIGDVKTYIERDQYIASVAPAGNSRIDSGAILRKLKTKAGDFYNPSVLREDLKAIYKMGFFNDVQIDVSDSKEGKIVIFNVIEKPAISSITYSGLDEIKEEDVAEVANIKANSILNPARVNSAAEAIKALYRSKGFYNTEVEPEISYPTPETAEIRFVIDEGEKIFIKEIAFEGNTTYDQGDLRDVIETDEKGWFSWLTDSGLLDKDMLNQDAGRITAFYHNNGFLEARVGEPVVTQQEEWLYITFPIQEGPRFKVGTVDIEGDLIADKQIFLDMMSIRNEEFMSRQVLREDILKIADYYAEQGYAFADVNPDMTKSASGTRVDLNLKIDKGDLVYINRISIRGNTRTRDNVIRRDLKIAEGGVFNAKGIRTSSQKLQRLDYFEEVNITPEPALDPAKMNVVVDVKEKSTGQFSVGAGYSSVDKLILMGEISENNFLGTGHRLALSGTIGDSSNRYNLSWTNPRINDSNLSGGVDLFSWEREYDDYTKETKGGALRFGHPLWEEWRMYESYSFTDTNLSDIEDDASYIIRESQNVPITSAFKVSFVRDSRDRIYGASKGSKNQFSIKYAGGPLSGDAQFTKAEATSSWYFPLPLGTVFHVLGAAGYAWENETDKLPVYERFYLGGMNSIRGFEYGKVSPIDPDTGDRIGGDMMWYTNVELIIPLFKEQGLYTALFFDSGNSIAEDFDWDREDVAKAVGAEIRWLSPMGPIRIVWGYNLDPLYDEPESVWDFSIGGNF